MTIYSQEKEMHKKIRILAVVFHNAFAGAQTRILSLTPLLDKDSIETIFMIPDEEGPFESAAADVGSVHRIPHFRPRLPTSISKTFASVTWLLVLPITIYRIRKILKAEQIDIVHVNGLLCLHAPIAARLSGIPVVWYLLSDMYPAWLVFFLMPLVRLLSSKLIFESERTARYYRTNLERNQDALLIPEPVDLNKFKFVPSSGEIRSLRLGSVGNLSPRKGYHLLLNTMPRLVSFFQNATLKIAGAKVDQEYYTQLKRSLRVLELENHVELVGGIEPDEVFDFLRQLDVFVLPSLAEGTPLAIIEAMAVGLPVVASNVGGVSDLVHDGETGILVSPGDTDELIDAIIRLGQEHELRRKMGCNARKVVESQYSLSSSHYAHVALYRSLAP